MRRYLTAVLVVPMLAAMAACGSSGPTHAQQVAACTRVLQHRMDQAMANQGVASPQGRPPQCDGLAPPELKRIAGKIIARELRSGLRKMFGG